MFMTQHKPQRFKYTHVLTSTLMLIIAAVVGWGIIKKVTAMNPERLRKTAATSVVSSPPFMTPTQRHVKAIAAAHQARHQANKDAFWLTGVEEPKVHMRRAVEWKQRYHKIMEQYGDLTPATRRISQHFTKIRVTEFYRGVSREYMPVSNTGVPLGFEICLIPENEWRTNCFPAAVFYSSDWRAVMLVGVEMPPAYMASLLFHELGHAHKHLVEKKSSATSPPQTGAHIDEEIEMHELEEDILNAATDGRLRLFYEELYSRIKPVSAQLLLNDITPRDLFRYEDIVGTTNTGLVLSPTIVAKFLLGIGLYTIDKTEPESDRRQEKITYYRYLRSM